MTDAAPRPSLRDEQKALTRRRLLDSAETVRQAPRNNYQPKGKRPRMGESSLPATRDAPQRGLAAPALRQATAEDVQRLTTVLAEAFFDDPVFGWLMPEDSNRRARLRRYFGIELRHYTLPRGRVWATSDLSGAALSLPPGAWRAPPHASLMEGGAFGIHLSRAARLGAAMEWRHTRKPREPHYYVRDIGVHPDMQGKGLGSALLQPTLERCDRDGLPVYLEASSERSAALYERHGFKLTGELRIGGSPPLRLMLRPPVPTQAIP
jgi:GNAT superfamily N-acetyltransferase